MGWLTKAVSKVGDGLSSAAQNLRSGFVPQVLQFGELQVMTTALLAEGGYSYVYSAREVGASAKPFAVKKMITQDAEGAEVAELEVRVLEQLQTHAGIVGFHGWMKKEQGGKRCEYWMLLEYCPNGSLIDVLYRKGRGGEFERQPRLAPYSMWPPGDNGYYDYNSQQHYYQEHAQPQLSWVEEVRRRTRHLRL